MSIFALNTNTILQWQAHYLCLEMQWQRIADQFCQLGSCLLRCGASICKIASSCPTDIRKYIWNQLWYSWLQMYCSRGGEKPLQCPLRPLTLICCCVFLSQINVAAGGRSLRFTSQRIQFVYFLGIQCRKALITNTWFGLTLCGVCWHWKSYAFCFTPLTGFGCVAQGVPEMMTLPHIASNYCMLKASAMLPAATVSNSVMQVLPLLQKQP